jgi:hypothetical protein
VTTLRLTLLVLLSLGSTASATSCRSETDPYEELRQAVETNEMVFLGTVLDVQETSGLRTVHVEAVWKGPVAETVLIHSAYLPRKTAVIFANRSLFGWYVFPMDCLFLPDGVLIEEALAQQFGTPLTPPSEAAPVANEFSFVSMMFFGLLFLSLGGIVYWTWSFRNG